MSGAGRDRRPCGDEARGGRGAGTGSRWRAWRHDTWVRPYFLRYRRVLACCLLLGLGSLAFAVGLMFASGYAVSKSAARPEAVAAIMVPVALIQVFGLGKPVLAYLERLASHDWVLRMTSSLRLRLFSSLSTQTVFLRATRRVGDMLGLLAQDIGHVQNLYLRCVFPTVVAWMLAALACALLGLVDLWFAAVMLLCLLVCALLVPLVSVAVNGARQARVRDLRARLFAEVTDDTLGVADWIYSGRRDDYLARAGRLADELHAVEAAGRRFDRMRDVVLQLAFGLVAVLCLLWAGGRFGAGPGESPLWVAAFVLGFFPLAEALQPLPAAAQEAQGHLESVARLNGQPEPPAGWDDAERQEPRPAGTPSPLAADGAPSAQAAAPGPSAAGGTAPASPASAPRVGAPREPEPEGAPSPRCLALDAQAVTFRYPGASRDVLSDLTLHVPAGQRLTVLGRSGSGKSTLLSLVRGDLAPDAGRVLVGGLESRLLGDQAARLMGVIQQQTYLFNATLLENLRVGNPRATADEAWEALERVGLADLARCLPEGLSTMVDEAGLRFSGGERHRVALARVLLQDAPVVLLDEPTVGLDPVTERSLLETLFSALDGRTVVMVSHHLQCVGLTDRVVFLEGGTVRLDGSPEELRASSPRYRRLLEFDQGLRA